MARPHMNAMPLFAPEYEAPPPLSDGLVVLNSFKLDIDLAGSHAIAACGFVGMHDRAARRKDHK